MFFKKNKRKKNIYLDNASGTPINANVLKKMIPYFSKSFFNAGSIYKEGFAIRDVLNQSRKKIADILYARPEEIIFTDGGTEANNLVLRGLVSKWSSENSGVKPHIITSKIEHASILETCRDLEIKNKIVVSYVSVNKDGEVYIDEIKKQIKENTILITIGYVNGEIGVIQDIKAISKLIRHYRKHNKTKTPYFHTDAVQSVNYCDINVQKLGIDFMTINGSKIYGPKKIAALYKKLNIEINPILTGGSQEFGLCAGTENVPYIVGLSEALSFALNIQESETIRLKKLQKYTEKLLRKSLGDSFIINGLGANRIPNIINISILDLSSEEVVLRLDAIGVKASVKSACKSGEFGDSHVIKALRNNNTQSIRFSFGQKTLKKDIKYMMKKIVKIISSMENTLNKYFD